MQDVTTNVVPGGHATAVNAHDIATASISDTLTALHANLETGLTRAEIDSRRNVHG